MKPLKILLMLAVFVISFSGSNKVETAELNDLEIKKIDKDEFQLLVLNTDKKKKPNQNL